MGRIVVAAYRGWAHLLAERALTGIPLRDISTVRSADALEFRCSQEKPDVVLLIGWSWIVPKEIYSTVPVLCLHPSPLPRYRGGSPLQHQIMAGEKESAVSIFRVADGIDAGPVYAQCPISLDGSLEEIFMRIVQVGAPMMRALVDALLRGDALSAYAQEVDLNEPLKRRKPEESDLNKYIATGATGAEVFNFVRALDHPDYPRAFVTGADGKRVELGWVRPR